jgi:hypothetical protein
MREARAEFFEEFGQIPLKEFRLRREYLGKEQIQ